MTTASARAEFSAGFSHLMDAMERWWDKLAVGKEANPAHAVATVL